MIDRFESELGITARYAATGVLAKLIVPYCQHDLEIDDALSLRGLARIWERNKAARPPRRKN